MSARTLIETDAALAALERARNAARAHVNYGWTKRPGTHGPEAWSAEQHAAYDREYDQACREGGAVVGRSRPLYRGWLIIGDDTGDTKWEASRHGLKLRGSSEAEVKQMVDQRIRADPSGRTS